MSNYIEHARRELNAIGYKLDGPLEDLHEVHSFGTCLGNVLRCVGNVRVRLSDDEELRRWG